MLSKPGVLLRIEGASVFALSLCLYHSTGARWWIFGSLFLWPDLSMLGYVISIRLGSNLYNLMHTYFFPLALGEAGRSLLGRRCCLCIYLVRTYRI